MGSLKVLHVENIAFSSKALRRLVRGLRKMRNLQDLHLVNLEELEPLMDILAESLKRHKVLKKLDLRQNNLRTRDVSSLVLMLKDNKVL